MANGEWRMADGVWLIAIRNLLSTSAIGYLPSATRHLPLPLAIYNPCAIIFPRESEAMWKRQPNYSNGKLSAC